MRLVTRGDLDGLACAVLFTSFESISEILLVHPQDITTHQVEITGDDIIANLPYHPACALWFDHHLLTQTNRKPEGTFRGRYAQAPSAAQLVWEHFGKDPAFEKLVEETNRLDSAQLTEQDVVDPQGFILLGYTIDSRTGLGSFEFYFRECVEWVKQLPIDEVLEQPLVAERVRRIREEDARFREALLQNSKVVGNVVFTDFRDEYVPPIGNRFLVYTLFPQANVSVRVHWGPEREFVVVAVAHSIFDRSCQTRVGELMAQFGGGGHVGAGSAPIPVGQAEEKLNEILEILQAAG